MYKRIVRVIAAGVGAAFVLTACAVSNRQIVTGPNGLVVEPLNLTTTRAQPAAPVVAPPAEERALLPAPATEKAPQPSSAPEQSGKAVTTSDAAKSVEQTKASAAKSADSMSHGCAGYGYAEGYGSVASDD
ncbi:MAG: hypothetical protein KatS3mg052_2246 [Candidatus Roseilinea sp.]|nr:MAG: hypothetical protein KatS3mg052_2246 [Candidatus Roseilinea sp.]